MIKMEGKWLRIMALGLSLPSSILGLAWLTWQLIENHVVSKPAGFAIFFLVIVSMLVYMVIYAINQKDKS